MNLYREFRQKSELNGVSQRSLTIALAGQPNMGKSTIFNLLTGLNQHVGNWPGKTVEKKEGDYQHNHHSIHLIDLPGTYSLSANSPEEIISRNYILQEKPDLVVAVVSAANLERSLYLVSELIVLETPLLIVLNMIDVAEQEGIKVNAKILEAAIGVPVIPMIASRASGVRELLDYIDKFIQGELEFQPNLPQISTDHQHVKELIDQLIDGFIPEFYPKNWTSMKLLEGDVEIYDILKTVLPLERWETIDEILKKHEDAGLAIASGRYEWIERNIRAAVDRPKLGQVGLTDRLDRFATHPIGGLIILAVILGLTFWVTFTIGTPIQEWMDSKILLPLGILAESMLIDAPPWVVSLVVDGAFGGMGAVITFLPIIIIFFAAFGFLEDVGYMARAAYVMDNFMHWMGLHGKSFLPLFLGFGCNVPAVMGTRVIESWPARILTILLAPFVPCSARMAVLAFIAPAFFGNYAVLVSWGLILSSLVVLLLLGVVLNKIFFKGERTAFIMELPLYHIPNWRSAILLIWQRSLSFLKHAGTIILMMSIVVWALSEFPGGDLETSYLAQIGNFFTPVGNWMGLDWKLTVALISSFMAKENAIATLGVLFGRTEELGLIQTLSMTYTPAVGLAFMVVSLLFIPCAATVAVIKKETGSWKWTFVNIVLMLIVSIAAASAVYAIASAVGL
ncbi:MAG: ferrous iron transport protein B [Anaerolineaceae bacterium]|nr:ferrous iron transport protein B [Anaerolineaceae bacterium]